MAQPLSQSATPDRRDSASDTLSVGTASVDITLSSGVSSQNASRNNTPSLGAVSAAELDKRLKLLARDGTKMAIGAVRDGTTNEIISIAEAERKKLIDQTTEQRLYEAQAATGGIILHTSGKRLSPKDAAGARYINPRLLSGLNEAYKAWTGFPDRRSGKRNALSLPEALKSGAGSYETMTRLLENQVVLGGIVDTTTKCPMTLADAVERGWVEARKAERLADFNRHSRQLTCPRTNMNSTYAMLVESCEVVDGIMVLVALPRKQRSLKLASGLDVRASSLSSSRASSRGASPPRRTYDMGQF